MKNLLSVVVAVAAVCSGCLFDAPVVPGKAEPIDPKLVGSWRCLSPADENPASLRISALPQDRYAARLAGPGEEPTLYGAQAVKLDGQVLVNVQEVKDKGEGGWTVVRYTLLKPDVLQLEAAQDDAFKDAKTADARLAVLKQGLKKGAGVFGPFCTCIKADETKK
jgi:hypothetical protein